MIGKVGRSRANAKGAGGKSQFKDIINYITREADGKGREVAAGEMGVLNLPLGVDEMDMNIEMMDIAARQTQKNGKFKGDPVYHLVLSWREEDSPNVKQVEDCVKHTLKALGMEECQAVWAIHHDTKDDHVHIAVNRVHPTKGIVAGPPHHDYFIIDKAMRELEIKHGVARDNGPFITVDTDEGPRIVRMSRTERKEKGLLKHGDEIGPATTPSARQAERNQGADSFQRWAQGDPASALVSALRDPEVTWQDLHQTAARFGMTIQTKGTGMVVTTELDGRTLACPISKLDRSLTRMKLEERLGPFEPQMHPSGGNPSSFPPPHTTYKDFLKQAQAHGSAQDGPEPHDDGDGKRAKRRAERQQARDGLHQRYQQEKDHIKDTRRNTRKTLLSRQTAERAALSEDHKTRRKPQFIAQKMASGMDRQMATGLWAYQAAKEKEELQKRHLKERMSLPRTVVWRDWLEQEAAKGDEAALSALRGIRYRERRKENQERNGFEGEELDALKPLLSKLSVRMDARRQKIHYLDAQGKMLFTDTGPRIDVHDKAATSIESALRLAAQKYGAVDITGSAAFREQAARTAARLGIQVRDADLQKVWQLEREATQPNRSPRETETRKTKSPERLIPQPERLGKER